MAEGAHFAFDGRRPCRIRAERGFALCFPMHSQRVVVAILPRSVGRYSEDGRLFVASTQGQDVVIMDTERNFRVHKRIRARHVRWTVTDT